MDNTEPIKQTDQKPVVAAIILAGAMIAGAILLRGSSAPENPAAAVKITPVSAEDRVIGNPKAKVGVILYEDFQCPFCGAVSGLEPNSEVMAYLKEKDPNWEPFLPELKKYANEGKLFFVYRDFAFLGEESLRAAEAARCAGDQGKFWEYHDYLYSHQNGENKGSFSDNNLKSFASILGLDTAGFNACLDSGQHAEAVLDSNDAGRAAGVTGTPKGFILRNGKVVATIDGAEPFSMVKPKLESALK